MSLRSTVSSVVVILVATAACTPHGEVGDPDRGITTAQATAALLSANGLPGRGWHPSPVPDGHAASGSAVAAPTSSCSRVTRELAKVAAAWGTADVDVTTAYTSQTASRQTLLKQEIAADPRLNPSDPAAPLRRQADACRNVTVVRDDETVESSIRVCELRRCGPGMQVVQRWSTSSGRSGPTQLAYLFRRRLLTVVTQVSSGYINSCDDAAFGAIVRVAAAKVDSLV